MEWLDIKAELLEDPLIAGQGCDGLWDEFILEVINASIDGRNRYCSLNGWKELPHVIIEDGEFMGEDCLQ